MRKLGVSRVGLSLLVLLFMLAMPMGCMSWSEGKDESTTSAPSPMSPSSTLFHGGQPGPESMVEPGFLVAMDFQLDKSSRYALVFGNGKYTKMPALTNPVNDAGDVAGMLANLGFKVRLETNATLSRMEGAVREFSKEAKDAKASTTLFFYVGHGVQYEGVNYLFPIDADIQRDYELRSKALSMDMVSSALEDTKSGFNLVVLDACRDNPFC